MSAISRTQAMVTMITAIGALIGFGGGPLMSIRMGRRDMDGARQIVANSFYLLLALSVLATVPLLVFRRQILFTFGCSEALWEYAEAYFTTYVSGTVFAVMSYGLNQITMSQGFSSTAMRSVMLGAAVNIALDPVFIFVFQMGVKGAAIATIIGQVASFVVSVLYMPHFKSVQLNKSSFAPCAKVSVNIVIFGLSSFITQFAITIVMALTNNLLAKYGAQSVYGAEIPLTATGIVMKVNQIMIAILLGIATGTQPIIGYNYGAKSYHRVKKALEALPAVDEAVVSHEAGTAIVTLNAEVSDADLKKAVEDQDYKVTGIE